MLLKNKLSRFIVFLLLACSNLSLSQLHSNQGKLSIDGLVYGYNYDPSKNIFQKGKPFLLEGALGNVAINVLEGEKLIYTTHTDSRGEFKLKMNLGKVYKLKLSKQGYEKSILLIDVTAVPPEIASAGIEFRGMELAINSFMSKDTSLLNIPFGKLYYDERAEAMDFQSGEVKNKKGIFTKHEDTNTPGSLMKRAVIKNKNNIQNKRIRNKQNAPSKNNQKITELSSTENKEEGDGFTPAGDTTMQPVSLFNLNEWHEEHFTEENLTARGVEIQKAREQLEHDKFNAISPRDKFIIQERERMLNIAESELAKQKKLIDSQKKLLYLTISFLLIVFGFLILVYKNYKEKQKINILLNSKNKKITDSINYAKRIQGSVLLQESEIKKLLPQSFIFYKPRDIVSGDFYWFSELEDKIIVAAVDCTGHGIPGAFLSLIGTMLLNEIVIEKQVIQASSILNLLHASVLKALHRDSGEALNQDGMEMSLCIIDHKKNIIEYAGSMNPVYVANNNAVTIIKPDIQSIGGNTYNSKDKKFEFSSKFIPIHKSMSLYMCTDGYKDQFGGPENKKFSASGFMKLLLDIQSMDMDMQKQEVENTIKKWKGDYQQIDDILVMGIKF